MNTQATVLSDIADGVMTITLNRPEAANAVRPDDRDALIALLAAADADEKVRVVVLRANGKHFCSGADVGSLAERRAQGEKRVLEPTRRIMNGAQKLVASVLDCNKPVIAAVHGAATGLGAHVVYASDLVIATENAYFAESFVKRGLVVDGGGCYRRPRRIGMQKAKEMAFFGERLSASEAFTLG
ncbi:MAG: enoyl-CoA hydratase/isomerase family protein, partial [Mycobacterium sp.]